MATITVATTTIPNFRFTASGVLLRVYLLESFLSSAGIPLQEGAVNSKTWYKQITCSLSGTDLTIPQTTLDSTTDGLDITTARYACVFYDQNGRSLGFYQGFENFRLSHLDTNTTWQAIRQYNFTRAVATNSSTYTKDEILALIGSGASSWGNISGTLASQSDLQTALDGKLSLSGGTMTGALRAAAGSPSAPSLTIGQADAGFYQIAANQIGFKAPALGNSASIGQAYFTIQGERDDLSADFFRVESYSGGSLFSTPFRIKRDAGVLVNDYLGIAEGQLPAGGSITGYMLAVGNDLGDASTATLVLSNSPVVDNDLIQGFRFVNPSTAGRTFTVAGDGRIAFGVLSSSSVPMIKPSGTDIHFKLADDSAFTNLFAGSLTGGASAGSWLTLSSSSAGTYGSSLLRLNPSGEGQVAIGFSGDSSGAQLMLKGKAGGYAIISAADSNSDQRFSMGPGGDLTFLAAPATSGSTTKNTPFFRFQSSWWNGSSSQSDTLTLRVTQGGAGAGQNWLLFDDRTDSTHILALGNSGYGNVVAMGGLLPISAAGGQLQVKSTDVSYPSFALYKLTAQTADIFQVYDTDGSTVQAKLDAAFNFQSASVRGAAVTVANLPATPVAGMMVAVTDSNTNIWGATIAGSGANTVLAFYNGTDWTVAGK